MQILSPGFITDFLRPGQFADLPFASFYSSTEEEYYTKKDTER